MLTNIFLIRHATPLQHTGLAYRTMPGPGISDKGRREARQAALFLADKQVEHLFVSPFARTVETAEQIVDYLDLPVTFTSLIAENAPDESTDKVQARIREFLHGVQDSPFRSVGMVSHGYPIRVLVEELSQGRIDFKQYIFPGNNPAPTAGIWHARYHEQVWQLELIFQPDQTV